MSSFDSLDDNDFVQKEKRRRSASTGAPSRANTKGQSSTFYSSGSSPYSSNSKSKKSQSKNDNANNPCCQPNPCCPQTMCYNPNSQQIYQAPCQVGVIPMRSAAFEAPCIPLPKLCERVLHNDDDEDNPEEDGVQFQFKPQTNCRTEVTFTIEPKPQPPWLTMLNCGFKPMVNCSAPPCYLSPQGNPGTEFCGGMQSFVNRSFGNQVNYCGMGNFPTLRQIQKTFPGSCVICDDEDESSSSSSSSESSASSKTQTQPGIKPVKKKSKKKKDKKKKKKNKAAGAHHAHSSSSSESESAEELQLIESDSWHAH